MQLDPLSPSTCISGPDETHPNHILVIGPPIFSLLNIIPFPYLNKALPLPRIHLLPKPGKTIDLKRGYPSPKKMTGEQRGYVFVVIENLVPITFAKTCC